MTEWTARRVGDRILCGRRVPPDGPPACMGEIAFIRLDAGGKEMIVPRPGLYAEFNEWKGNDDFPRYRETTSVRFRKQGRESGYGFLRMNRRGLLVHYETSTPFSAPCSHGGHPNHVPRGV